MVPWKGEWDATKFGNSPIQVSEGIENLIGKMKVLNEKIHIHRYDSFKYKFIEKNETRTKKPVKNMLNLAQIIYGSTIESIKMSFYVANITA